MIDLSRALRVGVEVRESFARILSISKLKGFSGQVRDEPLHIIGRGREMMDSCAIFVRWRRSSKRKKGFSHHA